MSTTDARGNLHDSADGRFAQKPRSAAAGHLDGEDDTDLTARIDAEGYVVLANAPGDTSRAHALGAFVAQMDSLTLARSTRDAPFIAYGAVGDVDLGAQLAQHRRLDADTARRALANEANDIATWMAGHEIDTGPGFEHGPAELSVAEAFHGEPTRARALDTLALSRSTAAPGAIHDIGEVAAYDRYVATGQELLTEDELNQEARMYLASALWTSHDEEGEPLDAEHGVDDFDDEDRERARALVSEFVHSNLGAAHRYRQQTMDVSIGHDLWLTRNGHGAGFWDRGAGQAGDELSAMAKPYGEQSVEVGDDGKPRLIGG